MNPERLRLHCATRFWARLRGLHARPLWSRHTGLWIAPCWAVHTIGLPYSIDLIFLDKKHNLLKRVEQMKPNRVAWHWGAASVVELPAGYCAAYPDFFSAIQQELSCRTSKGLEG